MIKTMRHILKADEVIFDDPLPLDLEPTQSQDGPPRGTAAGPRVRIAQSRAEYAVVEVTCACGQTIHIRCDYQAADSSPGPQRPAQVQRPMTASGEVL